MFGLLTAPDEAAQLSIVHGEAEPAHVDCGCKLYVQGLAAATAGALMGDLGPPPYGCLTSPADTEANAG